MLNEVTEGSRFTTSYSARVKCPGALPLVVTSQCAAAVVTRKLSPAVRLVYILRFVYNEKVGEGRFLN